MTSYGRPSLPNIYNLSDVDQVGDCFDTSAKKRIYPNISGAGIFVTIGQSRITNNSAAGATPYVVTQGVNSINLNPYDGCYYIANDPVLGCSASAGYLNSGWHGMMCDKLIVAGKYSKVVVIPCGIGGSSVTQWNIGGVYNDRIRAVSALLTGMGITPTAWLWQQGTTDSIAGMDQNTYQTNLRAVIAYQRGLPGRSSDKWMIAQDTIYGANLTSSAIRAAQLDVSTDTNNYLGPDCDTMISPTYSDGTHFNGVGNDAVAGLWTTKIQANF